MCAGTPLQPVPRVPVSAQLAPAPSSVPLRRGQVALARLLPEEDRCDRARRMTLGLSPELLLSDHGATLTLVSRLLTLLVGVALALGSSLCPKVRSQPPNIPKAHP